MKTPGENKLPRIHRNLADAVVYALEEIFYKNRQADKVIEQVLKSNPRWGSRDRGFIAENVYEMVRWWRLIIYTLNEEKYYPVTLEHLYRALGVHFLLKYGGIPSWDEFREIPQEKALNNYKAAQEYTAIRESIPNWLHAFGEKELGTRWAEEIHALNEPAEPIIRVNTLKISAEGLHEKLEDTGIPGEFLQGYPDALRIVKKSNLFAHPLFKEGFFEMQDASSQLVAPFLEAQPGMRVVDACAGAGGKSLHLAALMENKGRIISMDVEDYKLAELKKRSNRAGISIIETRLIEGTKTIKRLENQADRVLLDVPCSGSGVLRRNPDAKWKLSTSFIEKIRKTQAEIFSHYAKMVKPGGKLVYATCSIFPSENTAQVKAFLEEKGKEWEWEEEKIISPAKEGFDGFYMARLKRIP